MGERVVVAPDKFKGSLTAAEVTAAVAAGLVRGGFIGEIEALPVADGGDGTVAAAVAAGFRRVELGVRGPVGKNVTASYALLGDTAVIEAAQACGLTLLPPGSLAPLTATSRGVGELILTAIRMGAKRIVLGVGGVATTDGGAGLLQALGARLADDKGRELPPGGGERQREALQRDDLEDGLRDLDDVKRKREDRAPQQLAAVLAGVGQEPALERGHARRRVEDVEAARARLHHQVRAGRGKVGPGVPEAGQQAQHAPLAAHARVVKGLCRGTHSVVVVRSSVTQDSTKV